MQNTSYEISFMENVIFNWFDPLTADEKRLVWARAHKIGWKILAHKYDKSKVTLWRGYNMALAKIAVHIHAKDCRYPKAAKNKR